MYVPEMSVISYVCKPANICRLQKILDPGSRILVSRLLENCPAGPFSSRILVSHVLVHGTGSPGSRILANFRTQDPGF